MARTYEPIASQTLGSDAASVTFSDIPQTYTDLIFQISTRATAATYNNNSYLQWRYNGESAGGTLHSETNITTRSVSGTWTVLSQRGSNGQSSGSAPIPSNSHAAGIFNTVPINIMSYSNTSIFKVALTLGGYSSNLTNYDGPRPNVDLWRSTDAITSIQFFGVSGNLMAGSTFSLYGIKAA